MQKKKKKKKMKSKLYRPSAITVYHKALRAISCAESTAY